MSKPRPIVVTGMHRSGTSAIAKMLDLFGFRMWSKDNKSKPSDANPKGYNENSVMFSISEAILGAMKIQWDTPVIMAPGFEEHPTMADIWKNSQEYLEGEFPGNTRVVWKDPRVCLTYPFWSKFLGKQPVVIMCVRNPVEVAKSLWARERMKPGLATCLWKTHMVSLLMNTKNTVVLPVMYEKVIENPEVEMLRVWSFIERHADASSDAQGVSCDSDTLDRYAKYIDKKLHHQKASLGDLFDPTVDVGAVALYARMANMSVDSLVDAIVKKV